MPSFKLHANDAEAFVEKFGQPVKATPSRDSVILRYNEMENAEEARKIEEAVQEARIKAANPSTKILRCNGGVLSYPGMKTEKAEPKATKAVKKAAKKVAKSVKSKTTTKKKAKK